MRHNILVARSAGCWDKGATCPVAYVIDVSHLLCIDLGNVVLWHVLLDVAVSNLWHILNVHLLILGQVSAAVNYWAAVVHNHYCYVYLVSWHQIGGTISLQGLWLNQEVSIAATEQTVLETINCLNLALSAGLHTHIVLIAAVGIEWSLGVWAVEVFKVTAWLELTLLQIHSRTIHLCATCKENH